MAGTPHGRIESVSTTTTQAGTRDSFVLMKEAFDAHPNTTRIASQYGLSASGFDFTDGTNPAGENAFCVWRFDSASMVFYVLLQWSYNSSFGASPGNPGDSPDGFGTCVQVAMDTSGGNPWNGDSDDDGTDAKGATVWTANGGTLLVFPRGNGVGGSFATNKEACIKVMTWSPASGRYQVVMDDDGFVIAQDAGNNGGYNYLTYFGPYTPLDGITADAPYVMIQTNIAATHAVTTSIGTLANSSTTVEGGVAHPNAAKGVRTFRIDRLAQILTDTETQPNGAKSGKFDAIAPTINLYDPQGAGTYGAVGTPAGVKEICQVPTHESDSGRTKVAIGGTTSALVKWFIDWDGTTKPGSGTDRDGVTF